MHRNTPIIVKTHSFDGITESVSGSINVMAFVRIVRAMWSWRIASNEVFGFGARAGRRRRRLDFRGVEQDGVLSNSSATYSRTACVGRQRRVVFITIYAPADIGRVNGWGE